MTKIKICGLRTLADIQMVNELAPDYIGFVFAAKSKRYVTPEQAQALRAQLSKGIKATGVFVNAPLNLIGALTAQDLIDVVQLHGQEDAAYVAALKHIADKPVMQAFCIKAPDDIASAAASLADMILLDHGAGGTGHSFDWSLTAQLNRPFFLAGGLASHNVRAAIEQVRPYAVDTSSGVETGAQKDYDKVQQFIASVRGTRVTDTAAGKH